MSTKSRAPVRRGAAMVEMAIVLPLLILLTFGAIEYGWMFFKSSQISQAARHGVRTAVRPAATEEEVVVAIESMMSSAGLGDSGYTYAVGDLEATAGTPVSVTIDVTYDNIALTGFPLLPVPETLRGAATMAKEGPS